MAGAQGDAPVHSIGAALFAKKEQIHFFEDIGYKHNPFQVRLFPVILPADLMLIFWRRPDLALPPR
jgi:hypothetical protein